MTGINLQGYYDDQGNWQRMKMCFVFCGDRCNCGPPGGLQYSAAHDKRLTPTPTPKDASK